VGGRKAQPIIDTKNSAMSINTSIAIIYNNDAEGGTRTRTAFWARGFSYHYSFRYPPLFSGLTVCGLDDAFSMHVLFYACLIRAGEQTMFRREPSRLYTLLVSLALARRCHSADAAKVSPNLTPSTPAFPSDALKLLQTT
jgi:hypothetical protein